MARSDGKPPPSNKQMSAERLARDARPPGSLVTPPRQAAPSGPAPPSGTAPPTGTTAPSGPDAAPISNLDTVVNDIVAKAIQSADWTFFNENYSRQAEEVVRALYQAGFAVIPVAPTQEMLDAGRKAIEIGQYRPSAVARDVYDAMCDAGRILP